MSTEICTIIEIPGYFSDEDVAGEFSVTYGRWFREYSKIVLFIESLALHSRHILQTLNDELHCKVLHSIGHLAMRVVEGVVNIQAERNERSQADNDLLNVLPHELMSHQDID